MAVTATLALSFPSPTITVPNSDPSGNSAFTINGQTFTVLWATSATATAAALVALVNASTLYPGIVASNVAGVITIANASIPAVTSITAVSHVTLSGALAYHEQQGVATLTLTSDSSGDTGLSVTQVQPTYAVGTALFSDEQQLVGEPVAANTSASYTYPIAFFSGQPGGVSVTYGLNVIITGGTVVTPSSITVQVDPIAQVAAQ